MQHWPREIAFPQRRFVQDREEFIKLIKAYNGKKNIYFSIYNCCSRQEYRFGSEISNFQNHAIIDKVFFDLDIDGKNPSLEKPLQDLKKLIAYCQSRNYKFSMCFSGKKGYHFYLYCKKIRDKEFLRNAHLYISKILDINLDIHIRGDIARVSRVPNTIHLSGERYCIPLSIADVEAGTDFIAEKALQPNPDFNVYGAELLDLTSLPNISIEHSNGREIPEFDYNKILDVDDKLISDFPMCVQSWLTTYENATHRNRFLFALYCAHSGLTPEECNSLAKKYYGQMKERSGRRTRYQEFISERAVEYAYVKDFILPSCNKLFEEGACLGRCSYYKKDNFYLYKDIKNGEGDKH